MTYKVVRRALYGVALGDCRNIEYYKLPEGIMSFNTGFLVMPELHTLILPESFEVIGSFDFMNCKNLKATPHKECAVLP